MLSAVTLVFTEGRSSAADDSTKSIAGLRAERIKVLEELVAYQKETYVNGMSDITSVIRAMSQLAEAKIETAKDLEAEIEIRRDILKLYSSLEALVDQRVKNGLAGRGEFLAARANRLKAELELLKAKKRSE